jgi:hypothetical protein
LRVAERRASEPLLEEPLVHPDECRRDLFRVGEGGQAVGAVAGDPLGDAGREPRTELQVAPLDLGVARRLVGERAEQAAVRPEGLDERRDRGAQDRLGLRLGAPLPARRDRLQVRCELAQQLEQDRVAVGEVFVERGALDAGALGDQLDRDLAPGQLLEQLARRVEEPAVARLPLCRVALPDVGAGCDLGPP